MNDIENAAGWIFLMVVVMIHFAGFMGWLK